MATKPAKLLRITLTDIQPTPPLPTDDGTGDPWLTNAYLWNAKIAVTPQPHSSHVFGSNFYYSGLDVVAGDWIVTSGSGAALKIKSITSATETLVNCVLEDVNRANAFQNPDQSGQGEIPMGEGLLFEVKNGLPILYPLPDALPGTIPLTVGIQLISRSFNENTIGSGGGNTLETPADGTFTDGAVKSWQVGQTTYSTAIDDLNKMLGLLVPTPPPALSTKTLAVGSNVRSGSNILLCNNVVSNTTITAGKPTAGQQVYHINTTPSASATITSFGSGTTGSLNAIVNGTIDGTITLSSESNVGSNASLQILREADFPADKPGFWQELDAKISSTVAAGLNSYKMTHTETGATNEAFFVYEAPTLPTVTNLVVAPTTVTVSSSSGVPHYSSGSILHADFKGSGLSTNVYLSAGVAQVGSNPTIGTQVDINPGQSGLSTILDKVLPTQNLAADFTIGGNTHTSAKIRVRSRNAHADSSWLDDSNTVLVMSGTITSTNAAGPVVEMSIPVLNLGTTPTGASANAFRIAMTGSDKPADDKSTLTSSDWNSANPLATHDASVVGGVLQHDVTNYSTGYLPAGPNYSTGRDGAQYVTFAFRRSAVSNFKIEVNGTYAGLWVKLPGLQFPTATNGWLDMFRVAGASGVPGRAPNNDGCAFGSAATGNSGTFTCTFGTESSTNSSNNLILIRFKLTTGQKITGLAFKG